MYYRIPEQKMVSEVRGNLCDVYFDYNYADPSVGVPQSVTINRVMRNGKNVMGNMVAEEIKELKEIALNWFCVNFDGDNDPEYDD